MRVEPEPTPDYDSQECNIGFNVWSVPRLVSLTSGLEVMSIPLAHLNVSDGYEWLTLRQMVGHIQCINNADMALPIILDENGEIMDGRHRIMRALLDGAKTIKAVRFSVNPDPCRVEDE